MMRLIGTLFYGLEEAGPQRVPGQVTKGTRRPAQR